MCQVNGARCHIEEVSSKMDSFTQRWENGGLREVEIAGNWALHGNPCRKSLCNKADVGAKDMEVSQDSCRQLSGNDNEET